MKYFSVITLCMFSYLGAMDKPAWDVERMATRMANQRRAGDTALIKEIQKITAKSYNDVTHEEKNRLYDLAWKHKNFCILEAVCQTPLFTEKDMQLTKDHMLYVAVQEVSVGMRNTKRRARVIKNVELLLKNGAAQDESRFTSNALSALIPYVFECCGTTEKDFKVRCITKKDHLDLIGLFVKYVKHDFFKEELKKELQKQKIKDREWAQQIADVAIQNGVEKTWVEAI